MAIGNWESNPAGDWARLIMGLWDACKSNRFRSLPPDLIITKATVATVSPDCTVSIGVGSPGEDCIQVEANASEAIEQEYPAVVSEAFEVRRLSDAFPSEWSDSEVREHISKAQRLLDELPILEEGRMVWPASAIMAHERERNRALNEAYMGMISPMLERVREFNRGILADRESLPQTSKPPESASTCSSCKAENLENFLRAGGKVYCHACFEKFPPCCFCGNKVPWEASYTSKRDDKRLACPPCIEERKGQKLVKEVAG